MESKQQYLAWWNRPRSYSSVWLSIKLPDITSTHTDCASGYNALGLSTAVLAPALYEGCSRSPTTLSGISRLVKEDVAGVWRFWNLGGEAVEVFDGGWFNFINDVIIEEQPQSVALNDTEVVASVDACPAVHHHRHQVEQTVGIDGVIARVKYSELEREDHPVRQLLRPVQLPQILEAFQVQYEDARQLLHTGSLLMFL